MQICIENMSLSLKGVPILQDINITMESGNIYGLQGTNGSGKTMLLRVILGLVLPTAGTVTIDGELLYKDISFPKSVGELIENPAFLGHYTGLTNLKLIAAIKNEITEEQIKEAIREVGLNPDDQRKYRKYSLGMKQRLAIACAIMENPDLLILDEPANALDDNGIEMVHELLRKYKEQNKLVIVTYHDKEVLKQIADEIFTVQEGKIALVSE